MLQIKAITLGPTGSGKSSFLNRIVHNKFTKSTLPTIGVDFFSKEYPIKNAKIVFWDTAGQEYYNSLNVSYYRNSSIIICLFDLNDTNGIDDIIKKLEDCNHYCSKHTFVSLIGNKSDLQIPSNKLQTISKQINNFCNQYNAKYYQISCLNGDNCNETINDIIDNCLENYPKEEEDNMETVVLIPESPQVPSCKKLFCCRI